MRITAYNPDTSYNLSNNGPTAQAGGDLEGYFPAPEVWGMAGHPLNGSNSYPAPGWVLTGMAYGTFGWEPGGGSPTDARIWRPLLASDGTIVTAGVGGEAVMGLGPP